MTLKQKLFLKELPKNNYNISKSMKEAGYSAQTSVSGEQYKILRKLTNKIDYYSEENIKKEQMKALKRFRISKDNSNYQRAIEHMARISGIIIDKSESKSDLTISDKQKLQEDIYKRFAFG